MMTSCAVSPVCGCLSPNPGWSHLVSYSHSFRGSGELTGFGWQWAAGLWRAMELLANHRGDCLLASHFSTTPAWGVARFCCRASVSSAGERSNPMLCAHRSLSSSHVNNWIRTVSMGRPWWRTSCRQSRVASVSCGPHFRKKRGTMRRSPTSLVARHVLGG